MFGGALPPQLCSEAMCMYICVRANIRLPSIIRSVRDHAACKLGDSTEHYLAPPSLYLPSRPCNAKHFWASGSDPTGCDREATCPVVCFMTVDKEANTARSINCIQKATRPLYSSIYLRTVHRIACLLKCPYGEPFNRRPMVVCGKRAGVC